MSNENDWRSTAFRQRVIMQLDNLIRESATKTQRNAEELENQVYSRSTNRNEYLQYIGRVVMHLRRNLTHLGRQHLNRITNESLNSVLQNTGSINDSLTGSPAVDQRNSFQTQNVSSPSWQNGMQKNQIQAQNNITLSKVTQNGEQFNIQMSIGNAEGGGSGAGGGGGGGSSQQHMTPSMFGNIPNRIPSPAANGIGQRTPSPANSINQVPPPVLMHSRTPSPALAGLLQHRVPSPRVPSPAAGIVQYKTPTQGYEKSKPDIIVPHETQQWPRPIQISEDWKSWRTRQRVIKQLDDLIKQAPQTTALRDSQRLDTRRDAQRLELQVFQRSKHREEYLQYIARIVIRLRQSAQGPQQQQTNNHQTPHGNVSQGPDPSQIACISNNIPSNQSNRLPNNASNPEVITLTGISNNVASGSQTGNQTPLLQQSLQQLRRVKNSDDWKTRTFRQRIITQLEELNRWTPATVRRSPEELESQIFQRSNSKEEYMKYIRKVVLHMRQVKQANGHHSANSQGSTSLSSSQSSSQSNSLSIQQSQVNLTGGYDNHAMGIIPQVPEQESGNSALYDVQEIGNGLTAGGNSSQLRELLSSSSSGECPLQNVNQQANLYIDDFNNQTVENQLKNLSQSNESFDIQSKIDKGIDKGNDINNKSVSMNNEKTSTNDESDFDVYEKPSDSPGAFQLLLLGD